MIEYNEHIIMSNLVLTAFCNNDINNVLLPKVIPEARRVLNIIDMLGSAAYGKPKHGLGRPLTQEHRLTEHGKDVIAHAITSFETALRHSLESLPTYVVERIGIYDIDYLLTKADDAFPDDLLARIPTKSREDFRRAGTCLAFDLHTATGFHGYRAVDEMLRAYCTHFTGGLPKQRDWGAFIAAVRGVTIPRVRVPNARTIELMNRVRSIDRNPHIHPETDLDADEAKNAFDLCRTVITFMATDIENAP